MCIRDRINVTFMGYHGKWRSTDQVPVRAMESGVVGRYGNLDPTDGGNSQRYSLSFDWVRNEGRTTTRANASAGFYDLDLFSNFTFYMDSIARGDTLGDQFGQMDHRWFLGGELARDWRFDAMCQEQRFTLGVQLRTDIITGLGLYNTSQRQRWNTVRQDDICLLYTSRCV